MRLILKIWQFRIPILLIIAIVITQLAEPYVGDKTRFIHWNGEEGFVLEWHMWVQYVHKYQFYTLAILPLTMVYSPITLRVAKRTSFYCLTLYLLISVMGHVDYFYGGWPEGLFLGYRGLIYIWGTFGGFAVIFLLELLNDENFPGHKNNTDSGDSYLGFN